MVFQSNCNEVVGSVSSADARFLQGKQFFKASNARMKVGGKWAWAKWKKNTFGALSSSGVWIGMQ